MLTGHPNRASWKQDHELELQAIIRQMGMDEIRQAVRLMKREIHRREQEGPEQHVISEVERALFKNV